MEIEVGAGGFMYTLCVLSRGVGEEGKKMLMDRLLVSRHIPHGVTVRQYRISRPKRQEHATQTLLRQLKGRGLGIRLTIIFGLVCPWRSLITRFRL